MRQTTRRCCTARTEFSALDGVARVFADASFFYACLDQDQPEYGWAREMLQEVGSRGIAVVTTWEIVVEIVTLLRYRLGFRASEIFLRETWPALTVVYPSLRERLQAIEFYLQRSGNRRISLCDALSYVIVSTRLRFAPCLALDRDFAAMGLTVISHVR